MSSENDPQAVSHKPLAPDSQPCEDHATPSHTEPQTHIQALPSCLRCGAPLPGGVNVCDRCKARVCLGCGE